jgi:hypothetical protein
MLRRAKAEKYKEIQKVSCEAEDDYAKKLAMHPGRGATQVGRFATQRQRLSGSHDSLSRLPGQDAAAGGGAETDCQCAHSPNAYRNFATGDMLAKRVSEKCSP